jgi:hypothetical protein
LFCAADLSALGNDGVTPKMGAQITPEENQFLPEAAHDSLFIQLASPCQPFTTI